MFASLALLVASCATPPAEAPPQGDQRPVSRAVLADTSPAGGRPLFVGVGQRRHNREDEVEAALLHVADQVARYLSISAAYELGFDSNGRTTLVKENILTEWDPDLGLALADSFEIIDQRQDEEATYVIVTAGAVPPTPIPPLAAGGEEPPAWIDAPPRVEGFHTAVGVAHRRRLIRDSIDFADEDALKGIVLAQLATVKTEDLIRSVEEGGTITSGGGSVRGTGTVTGFLVVGRWVSADGRYFYSLAAAPVR